MSNPFKKFIQQGESGAKKKERIRQEKKKVRKETQEYFEKKKQEAREARAHGGGYKPEGTRDKAQGTSYRSKVVSNKKSETTGKASISIAGSRRNAGQGAMSREQGPGKKVDKSSKAQKAAAQPDTRNPAPETGAMPLNKFIAHAGICSRRDAAELVKAGKVIVNGENITEPGHKVTDKDDIKVNGKKLHLRRNLVYILLNKPKDYITTTDDPEGRKTVLDIIRNATPERVYPVGRLDRNTTGVLLLTNDGELAQKLSHPSYEIKKIYEVKLDKPLTKKDFETIVNGVTLEDGFIAPDTMAYADPKDKSVIGIEIHSGRNRIVRRIFEHIGYDVRNLDRVMYANLTKKNVERGKWRFLTEKEVRLLKYLNASYTKNKPVTRG
jgi:23S rRNA pseudouridine2605 synthase